jgi:predicted transcriptional regulator
MANAARRNWSLEDDARMLTAIEKNRSIEETAQLLGRKPEEVRERLSMLTREATGLFPRDLAAS